MAPLVCHQQQKCADWTARQAWLAVALLKVCRRKYLFGSWPGGLILKEPVVIYLFVHLNLMHAATFKNLQLFNTDFRRFWQRLPERKSYNQYLFTVLFQRELRWTTGLKHFNASPAAESKAFFFKHFLTLTYWLIHNSWCWNVWDSSCEYHDSKHNLTSQKMWMTEFMHTPKPENKANSQTNTNTTPQEYKFTQDSGLR